MSLSTWNYYYCEPCKMPIDMDHSIMVSLKILCPLCEKIMEHKEQIDVLTLEERLL